MSNITDSENIFTYFCTRNQLIQPSLSRRSIPHDTMIILYRIYQILIFCPLIVASTIITAIFTVIGVGSRSLGGDARLRDRYSLTTHP